MYHSHYDPDPARHLQLAAPCLSDCSVTRTVLEPGPDTLRKFDNSSLPSAVVNAPTAHAEPPPRGFVHTSQTSPAYVRCSTADNPRITWHTWSGIRTSGRETYVPTVRDKWWSEPGYLPHHAPERRRRPRRTATRAALWRPTSEINCSGTSAVTLARETAGSAGATLTRAADA